ncbi:MAG: hypothetical protein M1294_09880 [Firmicutes bacterium]|nr:hypothetical protein [Bacillota bacterium]
MAKAEYYTEAIAMPTNELRNLTESYLNVRRWRLSAGIFGFLATSIACFAWINQEHSAAIVGGAAAVVIWSMMRWYPSYFAHRTQIGQFDDSKSSPTGS